VHDSGVDLSRRGEVVYWDRGYFGVKPIGYDAMMRRGVRGHPLGVRDRLGNRCISRRRASVERAFAMLKRVFHAGHVLVTTVERVHVKMVFTCFCFNLLQMARLGSAP
jgi:IS5 family transposase